MRWPVVRLAEVAASVDYGYTASAIFEPIGPKFLRITDIQDGSVNWSAVPYCSASTAEEAANRLAPGDIVFARTGATTGKSFLIRVCPDRTIFASYLIRVRPGQKIDPGFLARFFETPDYWSQISQNARGAAQPGVNSSVLRELRLPLPSVDEQRRIAVILDQADDLRRKRQAAALRLDDLIESLFYNYFLDHDSGQFGGVPVQDIANVEGGLQFSGSRSSLPISVPYLRVANVYRNRLDLSEVKSLQATKIEIERKILQLGDVLVVEGHGNPKEIGRCAVWNGSIFPCVHQNHIIRIRPDQDVVLPEFISRYLNSAEGRKHLLGRGKTTSGLNTISVKDVKEAPIPLPPLDLQRTFAARVAEIDKLKAAQRAHLAKLDELFASLQHRAFRGEL